MVDKNGMHLWSSQSEAGAGGEATSEDVDPSSRDKVSATKMCALWALAIMLSIQAETADLLETPLGVDDFHPVPQDVPCLNTSFHHPPSSLGFKVSSNKQGPPSTKHPAASKGAKCGKPVVTYFVSSHELDKYLKDTLPSKIKDVIKCKEVGMAGLIGKVLTLAGQFNLLSALDATSVLSGGGGLGLEGLLHKKGNAIESNPSTGGLGGLLTGNKEGLGSLLNLGGKSSGKGLMDGEELSNMQSTGGLGGLLTGNKEGLGSLLNLGGKSSGKGLMDGEELSNMQSTGGLGGLLTGNKEGLGSLLNLGGKSSGKGLMDGEELSDMQSTLDDVVDNASDLKESVQEKVTEAIPDDIKASLSDLLEAKLTELLLKFDMKDVTEDSMDITIADNEIHVDSTFTVDLDAKGLLGPVINLLKFQAMMEVTLKIAISPNNTQCVNLEAQDTHIQVTGMRLQTVETLTNMVPLPLPMPLNLNDVILVLLTVEMNENLEKSNSCAVVFSDFNDCKNVTGLFKYQVQRANINPTGLSIYYCAEGNFSKKLVPVPGGHLSAHPKNANISVELSSTMMKTLLDQVAEQSSVQMNGLEANVTEIEYDSEKPKQLSVSYEVKITKDGEHVATGKANLIIAHESKISNNKLEPHIKLTSSELILDPPGIEEYNQIMSNVKDRAWEYFNELYSKVAIPDVPLFSLKSAPVQFLKSKNLQAAN